MSKQYMKQAFSSSGCDNYALYVQRASGWILLFFPWEKKKPKSNIKGSLRLFLLHLNSMSLSWKISGNDFSVWKYLNTRKYSSIYLRNSYFLKFSWGLSFMWDPLDGSKVNSETAFLKISFHLEVRSCICIVST